MLLRGASSLYLALAPKLIFLPNDFALLHHSWIADLSRTQEIWLTSLPSNSIKQK